MAATESALAAFRRVRTGYMTTGIADLDRIVTLRPGTMNFIQVCLNDVTISRFTTKTNIRIDLDFF
jgi:hypothetical protein